MQLGITMRINGQTPKLSMEEVLEAERLGYVSVWSGEAWGTMRYRRPPGFWRAPPRSRRALRSCRCRRGRHPARQ